MSTASQSVLPGTASHPPERNPSQLHINHEKWEELGPSSLTSSYPSLSFPSGILTPHSHAHPHLDPAATAPARSPAVRGPTQAALDTSLSPRSRALAILSSIAINVLLPFVNGVMLGFGEIFAKNVVVKWFGWKVPAFPRPGDIAAKVGLRKNEQEQNSSRSKGRGL